MIGFCDRSADGLWQQARLAFLQPDRARSVEGRTSRTRELRPVVLELTEPRNRWVVSRMPVMSPAGALSEVVWILLGRSDAAFVNFWNTRLSEYAGKGEEYHGAYGERLRRRFGIDQLTRAGAALRRNPNTRQVCLSIWNPPDDLPDLEGAPRSGDIPCNVMSLLKVRNGKLEWTQIMRSNDFWLGLPINIVQFTMLQEVLAGWIGVEVGSYHHLSDSLHIYPQHETALRSVDPVATVAENTDDLASVGQDESLELLDQMATVLDAVVSSEGRYDWATLPEYERWPTPYANVLRVVLADAARRQAQYEVAADLMQGCENPILKLMWERWLQRVSTNDPGAGAFGGG